MPMELLRDILINSNNAPVESVALIVLMMTMMYITYQRFGHTSSALKLMGSGSHWFTFITFMHWNLI